jgi:hypothetical protein
VVAIYLRVSTDHQTTENQERGAAAHRAGHEIVAIYPDAGISGSKGRDQRPGFDRMHRDAARRRFDIVMAWSVDRLGRSLQDLCGFLTELHALKIDLHLHQQGVGGAPWCRCWRCRAGATSRHRTDALTLSLRPKGALVGANAKHRRIVADISRASRPNILSLRLR